MSDYRDKLLGFGIRGNKTHHTTPVEGEHKPVAGLVTEHRDGHTDVTVFPDTVSLHQRQEL